jgi:hypothetical protein
MSDQDLILTQISLDEPSQLLSIIFDVSDAWYSELLPHIPPQHQQFAQKILSQLYFDTVSQICIFINTFLALNKRNVLHFIAVNNEQSIVLQQASQYTQVPFGGMKNGDKNDNKNDEKNDNKNDEKNDLLFPNVTWVSPNSLPRPAQANDELFGTTSSDIYSKLLLLNPFQFEFIPDTKNNQNFPRKQPSQKIPKNENFIRLFTGSFTKSLCFINKAKKYDQSLTPHILLFSLSPFQASSGYMSCALLAQRINCLVDTLCINHLFNHDDLQQEKFQPEDKKLSNLLTPIIQNELHKIEQIEKNSSHSTLSSSQFPLDQTYLNTSKQILSSLHKPVATPSISCHCAPHQQSSHITNGCSIYISYNDMYTLIQLYTATYSPISPYGVQNGENNNENNNQQNQSLESVLFKPQEYLYLLPLLQTHCLSSEPIRHHLITPIQTSVTLTAPCFCHPYSQTKNSLSKTAESSKHNPNTPNTPHNQKNGPISHSTLQQTQPARYLCNVCLVVVCQQFPQCPNCKSRFVLQKSAVQISHKNDLKNANMKNENQNDQSNNQIGQNVNNSTNTQTTKPTTTAPASNATAVRIPLVKAPIGAKPGLIKINKK